MIFNIRQMIGYCLITLSFMIGGGILSINSITHAQQEPTPSCPACTSTPAPVMRRVEFAQQMIGVTSNARINGAIINQRPTLGGFQGGLYQTANSSLFRRLYNTFISNISSKSQTLGATTFIMTSIATQLITKDGPLGFAVLFQSRAVLRDYTLIQDLDSELSNIILDIGLAGGYMKTIDTETLAAYNAVIQQYQSGPDPLRDPSSRLSAGTRYDQVMTMLWRMNGRFKTFVSTDNSNPFAAQRAYERNEGGIMMMFASGLDMQLEQAYSCVRGLVNQCSSQLQTFGDNIKKVGSDTASGAQQAVTQIKTAFKRLKETLTFKTSAHIDQVLRDNKGYQGSVRGGRSPLINADIDIPNPLSTSDKKLLHLVDSKIETDYVSRTEQSVKQAEPIEEGSEPERLGSRREARRDPITLSADRERSGFIDRLSLSRDSVEAGRIRDGKRADMASPLATTLQLRDLSALVLDSLNLLGSSSTPGSITYNLKQSCENQCMNKPGICE